MPIHRPLWRWSHAKRLVEDQREASHATSHSTNCISTVINPRRDFSILDQIARTLPTDKSKYRSHGASVQQLTNS
eukprot:11646672-Karenia_brevis.AAC.1